MGADWGLELGHVFPYAAWVTRASRMSARALSAKRWDTYERS
jgi:hypothetical protein